MLFNTSKYKIYICLFNNIYLKIILRAFFLKVSPEFTIQINSPLLNFMPLLNASYMPLSFSLTIFIFFLYLFILSSVLSVDLPSIKIYSNSLNV